MSTQTSLKIDDLGLTLARDQHEKEHAMPVKKLKEFLDREK